MRLVQVEHLSQQTKNNFIFSRSSEENQIFYLGTTDNHTRILLQMRK